MLLPSLGCRSIDENFGDPPPIGAHRNDGPNGKVTLLTTPIFRAAPHKVVDFCRFAVCPFEYQRPQCTTTDNGPLVVVVTNSSCSSSSRHKKFPPCVVDSQYVLNILVVVEALIRSSKKTGNPVERIENSQQGLFSFGSSALIFFMTGLTESDNF